MSGLSKLEKLMYTIGVHDKATGPVNKIMGQVNKMSQQANNAQNQMIKGFVGAAGGAALLTTQLSPAIQANRSLGEVAALGVADDSLAKLNKTALNFAEKYGGNSSEVISASYDIQSSIAGLTGDELSNFAFTSSIMAKAVKSNAGTATNYLGTMYGIYQDNAKQLGKNNWVEQLVGQTATAVRLFKTNGDEMSGAFTSLGAEAQSHGIEMAESMAILGQLQATMSGSEAGTKYKAFLAGVGNAQKVLGVTLTDQQGRLLAMPKVLEALESKFGDIDTVAKSDALKKAFGSQEATGLIKLLIPQISQLKGNISELNKQTGMQAAVEMANKQTDAWQRLSGSFNAVTTSVGQKLLPVIEPTVNVLVKILNKVNDLTDKFPVLTSIISIAVITITTLIVGMGALNIVMGLAKYSLLGTSTAALIFNSSMEKLTGTAKYARGAMLGLMLMTKSLNMAMMLNPIGIVIGLVALLATTIYKFWGPIKAFLSGFWQGFAQGFQPVLDVFSGLGGSLGWVGDLLGWVGTAVSSVVNLFSELLTPVNQTAEELAGATSAGEKFGKVVGAVFNFLLTPLKLVMKYITFVHSSLSKLSGWLKSFWGDDKDATIEAIKTVQHSNLPSNVIPINSDIANIGFAGQLANRNNTSNNGQAFNNVLIENKAAPTNYVNTLPFAGKETGQTNTNQVTNNKVIPFDYVNQFAEQTNQITSNKVIAFDSANQFAEQTNQVNSNFVEQKNNHVELNKPVVRKVEKSVLAQQFASSTNNTETSDQSRKVFIDNLTLKSDDIESDFEKMMELAS